MTNWIIIICSLFLPLTFFLYVKNKKGDNTTAYIDQAIIVLSSLVIVSFIMMTNELYKRNIKGKELLVLAIILFVIFVLFIIKMIMVKR